MRRSRRLIASGIIAVLALAMAAVAVAHDSNWLYHGGGGKGRVTNHHWLTKCDTDVDGHHVWIRYHTNWMQPYDDYASSGFAPSGGCNTEGSQPYGDSVRWYQVCVSYEGCTAKRDHSNSTW